MPAPDRLKLWWVASTLFFYFFQFPVNSTLKFILLQNNNKKRVIINHLELKPIHKPLPCLQIALHFGGGWPLEKKGGPSFVVLLSVVVAISRAIVHNDHLSWGSGFGHFNESRHRTGVARNIIIIITIVCTLTFNKRVNTGMCRLLIFIFILLL